MTRDEFDKAMAEAWPRVPEQEEICRAIDRRSHDQVIYDWLTKGREPDRFYIVNTVVHPAWNVVVPS